MTFDPTVIEKQPAVAAQLVPENRLPLLERYAAALAENGEKLGLLGPEELPRLWTRHLLNCAILAPLLKPGTDVADIGSGAGLPGIVLAIACPENTFRLVEPMLRRCEWLQTQIETLGLKNTSVQRGRAEEFHGAWHVNTITARAVAPLKKLVPLAAPLLKPGGELLLLKGKNVEQELTAATKALKKMQIRNIRIEQLGEKNLHETTRVFRANVNNDA